LSFDVNVFVASGLFLPVQLGRILSLFEVFSTISWVVSFLTICHTSPLKIFGKDHLGGLALSLVIDEASFYLALV
jgi:hypothetical protein